ncbi:LuxR C-terminal-related transcriptional regulator [Streptomyces fungicidicus]|uniref:LuxR C-terminal-related transcriptional regulator n=1 Tax=Streptomyces fungicidicus TaxID=68203 RepID=UPI003823D7DC
MKPLTRRQREVLRMVASGYTSAQAGNRLGVARATIDRHLADVYRQLGANDRSHAVALAIYYGHITLPELAAIAGVHTQEQAA